MTDKSLAVMVVCIRAVSCAVLLALFAGIIYGSVAFWYYSQSWRAEMTAKAYATMTINNAKADREAELIKNGQLSFCTISYNGCDDSSCGMGTDCLSPDGTSEVAK